MDTISTRIREIVRFTQETYKNYFYKITQKRRIHHILPVLQ